MVKKPLSKMRRIVLKYWLISAKSVGPQPVLDLPPEIASRTFHLLYLALEGIMKAYTVLYISVSMYGPYGRVMRRLLPTPGYDIIA